MPAKKSHEQFVSELAHINPNIEVLGQYTNSQARLKCRCKTCGHEWGPLAYGLLNGHGCSYCAKSNTSFMEQFIYWSFADALGEDAVLARDVTAIGMELDIYMPSINLAIEPGSWVWHKNKIKRDKQKREKAASAGVTLITIYDDVPPEAQAPCWAITFEHELGAEPELAALKNLVLRIFNDYHINHTPNWDTILFLARKYSARITTDIFIERMNKLKPNIEILGEYTNASTKLKCRCKVCDHEWSSTPNALVNQKYGCPVCAKKIASRSFTLTHKQFVERLASVSPNIEALGTYVNCHTKIKCRCKICGREWNSTPQNLLHGYGCPKCANKQRGKQKKVHCVEKDVAFDSISAAARWADVSRSVLSLCCRDKSKTAGGYHWEYVDEAAQPKLEN